MRYAAKVDATHQEIRDGLRKAGFSVFDASKLGAGFPDLVVGKHGRTYLIEVKTPRGSKTAQERLGAAQAAFRDAWRGGPVLACQSLEDALFDIKCYQMKMGFVK